MGLLPFKIEAGVGEHKVELDGHDVSNLVSRVTVDIQAGSATPVAKMYVEAHSVGTLEGLGIAVERVDDRQAVIDWLQNLDPERLERESLESLGLGGDGPATTGEAIVIKLLEWARGD